MANLQNCKALNSARGKVSSSDILTNLGDRLHAPIVLVGRGGSGTRLISDIAVGAGVFLGNQLNKSLDSREWVGVIYDIAVTKLSSDHGLSGDLRDDYSGQLQANAAKILGAGNWTIG